MMNSLITSDVAAASGFILVHVVSSVQKLLDTLGGGVELHPLLVGRQGNISEALVLQPFKDRIDTVLCGSE